MKRIIPFILGVCIMGIAQARLTKSSPASKPITQQLLKVLPGNNQQTAVFMPTADESFGKATFTVPAGWQMTKTTETVTLVKTPQKGVSCKIIISATEKGAITTPNEYMAYRTRNSGTGITYQNQRGAIIKYEADGLISFFSKGTTTQNMVTVNSYFYSLSNGSQTLYYQLLTSNNDCIDEFNQFMTTLRMDLNETGTANAKKRSPPPSPAAPAPVM